MKIAAVSDLHGYLIDIPECDLLLISGDICVDGNLNRQLDWLDDHFRRWLNKIPAKRVVACAGNHDFVMAEHKSRVLSMGLRWDYLQDEYVWVNDLKIWGTPWQRRFYDWAFNLEEADLARKWELIPEDTDILVCHSPPYMFGDMNSNYEKLGSPSLTERIAIVKPKLVVCGHIHPGYGVYQYNETVITNAAICTIKGWQYDPEKKPFLFEYQDDKLTLL